MNVRLFYFHVTNWREDCNFMDNLVSVKSKITSQKKTARILHVLREKKSQIYPFSLDKQFMKGVDSAISINLPATL